MIATRPREQAPVRVLVPYIHTYAGGVRSLLQNGLPLLAQAVPIDLRYAELSANQVDMDRLAIRGVSVDRRLGSPGSGAISYRSGLRRRIDLLRASPRMLRLAWRLRGALGGYDVVYTHGLRELLLAAAAAGALGAQRPALVWHCHGLPSTSALPLVQLLAGRCDALILVSSHLLRRFEQLRIEPSLIHVVPNAVDSKRLDAEAQRLMFPLPPAPPSCTKILIPCPSLRPGKGPHLGIAALGELPPSFVLWITGDPDDPVAAPYRVELDRLLSERRVRERVFFLGSRPDIAAVMAHADIILVPSIEPESFGLAAAEAMSLGRPVIVSDRGALPDLVSHGRAGRVFDPSEKDTLVRALLDTVGNPERTVALARNGRARAHSDFGYARWTGQVRSILESLAGR